MTVKNPAAVFLSAVLGMAALAPDTADAQRASSAAAATTTSAAATRAATTNASVRAATYNSARIAAGNSARAVSSAAIRGATGARYHSATAAGSATRYTHAGGHQGGGAGGNGGGIGGGNTGSGSGGGRYHYGPTQNAAPYSNHILPVWYIVAIAGNHPAQQIRDTAERSAQNTRAAIAAAIPQTRDVSGACVFLETSKKSWARELPAGELKSRIDHVLREGEYSKTEPPANADTIDKAIWQISLDCQ